LLKKVLSILFSVLILIGAASPTFAAGTDEDVAKALDLIEKTNKVIDEKIEKAVEKADNLQATYLLDIRKIEEGDSVVTLKSDREKVLADLEAAKNDAGKTKKLDEKLADINAKLAVEQAKINNKIADMERDIDLATAQLVSVDDKDTKKLEEKLQKLESKLNEKELRAKEKTERFAKDLDKVITDVYDETLRMSNDTIKKAAEKGVVAECSWKLVRFADQWVWIDPIRVVKFGF
jgi:hypothetical protein